MFAPNPPPPVGWGGVGVTCFGYFFDRIFFLSIFSAVREISRTFEILTPPPGRWTPRGGVGKNLFYWFSGHSWVSLTLVDWRQRKLPGFAQDNCIPEILFKPWSLVTLTFSPLTGWGGVGVTCFGYFFGRFFFYRFSRQFVKFPALLKCWPPNPPRDAGPPGWGG